MLNKTKRIKELEEKVLALEGADLLINALKACGIISEKEERGIQGAPDPLHQGLSGLSGLLGGLSGQAVPYWR